MEDTLGNRATEIMKALKEEPPKHVESVHECTQHGTMHIILDVVNDIRSRQIQIDARLSQRLVRVEVVAVVALLLSVLSLVLSIAPWGARIRF